jgi:hypothetical protein
MARLRQGIRSLKKPLLMVASLSYLGILIALFRKFGGEACEVFLFVSSLVATLIVSCGSGDGVVGLTEPLIHSIALKEI